MQLLVESPHFSSPRARILILQNATEILFRGMWQSLWFFVCFRECRFETPNLLLRKRHDSNPCPSVAKSCYRITDVWRQNKSCTDWSSFVFDRKDHAGCVFLFACSGHCDQKVGRQGNPVEKHQKTIIPATFCAQPIQTPCD